MNEAQQLAQTITEKLTTAFAPTQFELIDETHKHQKHKHFQSDKYHFRLRIASEQLASLSRIKAHQAIYAQLGDLMQTKIHALAIEIGKCGE